MGHIIVLFLRTSILFSIMATQIYISTNSVEEFPFLHILANTCITCLFLAEFGGSHLLGKCSNIRATPTALFGFRLFFV
jgi:hypothetical protein